jgi:hypothetical protein
MANKVLLRGSIGKPRICHYSWISECELVANIKQDFPTLKDIVIPVECVSHKAFLYFLKYQSDTTLNHRYSLNILTLLDFFGAPMEAYTDLCVRLSVKAKNPKDALARVMTLRKINQLNNQNLTKATGYASLYLSEEDANALIESADESDYTKSTGIPWDVYTKSTGIPWDVYTKSKFVCQYVKDNKAILSDKPVPMTYALEILQDKLKDIPFVIIGEYIMALCLGRKITGMTMTLLGNKDVILARLRKHCVICAPNIIILDGTMIYLRDSEVTWHNILTYFSNPGMSVMIKNVPCASSGGIGSAYTTKGGLEPFLRNVYTTGGGIGSAYTTKGGLEPFLRNVYATTQWHLDPVNVYNRYMTLRRIPLPLNLYHWCKSSPSVETYDLGRFYPWELGRLDLGSELVMAGIALEEKPVPIHKVISDVRMRIPCFTMTVKIKENTTEQSDSESQKSYVIPKESLLQIYATAEDVLKGSDLCSRSCRTIAAAVYGSKSAKIQRDLKVELLVNGTLKDNNLYLVLTVI